MIYSPRALNESPIHDVPKNNGLMFHVGEVPELWRKAVVNNSHVFNFNKCSVLFKM